MGRSSELCGRVGRAPTLMEVATYGYSYGLGRVWLGHGKVSYFEGPTVRYREVHRSIDSAQGPGYLGACFELVGASGNLFYREVGSGNRVILAVRTHTLSVFFAILGMLQVGPRGSGGGFRWGKV